VLAQAGRGSGSDTGS